MGVGDQLKDTYLAVQLWLSCVIYFFMQYNLQSHSAIFMQNTLTYRDIVLKCRSNLKIVLQTTQRFYRLSMWEIYKHYTFIALIFKNSWKLTDLISVYNFISVCLLTILNSVIYTHMSKIQKSSTKLCLKFILWKLFSEIK